MRKTYTLDALGFTPSDQRRFIKRDVFKPCWFVKFLKRWIFLLVCGQIRLERRCIPTDARRILWINLTAPSLGDALMDLAARRLLRGRSVDLLTDERNIALFRGDPWFAQVFSLEATTVLATNANSYDFVILDSYSPRSVAPKVRFARSTPFVGLYGFVNGFEVHRTLFSFHRLGCLLGLTVQDLRPRVPSTHLGALLPTVGGAQPEEHEPNQRSCLGVDVSLPTKLIAIGVGGEWRFRTYRHWLPVIQGILQSLPDRHLVLLGSENGLIDAETIEAGLGEESLGRVRNLVGRCSIDQTCAVLRRCMAYVGADGGLWHLATGCNLPSVVLLADCQLFDECGARVYRSSPDQVCSVLYANEDVSTISAQDIVAAVDALI